MLQERVQLARLGTANSSREPQAQRPRIQPVRLAFAVQGDERDEERLRPDGHELPVQHKAEAARLLDAVNGQPLRHPFANLFDEVLVPPGYSLLQELEMFVEAGLPPSAALQAATINNAAALKQESQLGSIEPGKLADLVILSADPTADIRNMRRIEKVIRGGRICEPAQFLKLVSLR